MDTKTRLLTQLGLSGKEAEVYLGALKVGEGGASEIAKAADVNRSTCYVTLDSLRDKGLVSEFTKDGTQTYAPMDPEIVLHDFESKLAEFEDLLPAYRAQFNQGEKPGIYFHEGTDNIERVYKQFIFPADTEWIYAFGTDVDKLEQTLPGLYDYWEQEHENQYAETKEIVSHNTAGLEYAQKNQGRRAVRVMPPNLPVRADAVITENRVFVVSLENEFGILTESKDLADMYKNFFRLAWRSALEPGEIESSK